MSKETIVTCDGCGSVINASPTHVHGRLVLHGGESSIGYGDADLCADCIVVARRAWGERRAGLSPEYRKLARWAIGEVQAEQPVESDTPVFKPGKPIRPTEESKCAGTGRTVKIVEDGLTKCPNCSKVFPTWADEPAMFLCIPSHVAEAP